MTYPSIQGDGTVLTPIPSVTNAKTSQKEYSLKKKSTNKPLLKLNDLERNAIVTWKDKLFFVQDSNNLAQTLVVFDFNTEKTQSLFETQSDRQQIADAYVLDNKLFFSVGGYMAKGEQYVIDDLTNLKPKLISQVENGKVMFWKDRYWIIGGEGDSCWQRKQYYLFDIKSLEVKDVARSVSGCIDGEEYVDIDARDEMILSYHTPESYFDKTNMESGVYEYVVSIPLAQPQIKNGVISRQDMPKNTTSMRYFKDKDALLFVGSTISIYWYQSRMIEHVTDLPGDLYRARIGDWIGSAICLWKTDDRGQEIVMEFNLEKKSMQDAIKSCVNKYSEKYYEQYQYTGKTISEKLTELSLPNDYEIVYE